MHHLEYETMISGDLVAINGYETPGDLDLLCRECHHQRHIDPNGEYWAIPNEMTAHWWDWFEHVGYQ